jgi:hypothetical protein
MKIEPVAEIKQSIDKNLTRPGNLSAVNRSISNENGEITNIQIITNNDSSKIAAAIPL